jgi:hypothetical protein
MIKLKISFLPKKNKKLELSQLLGSLVKDLEHIYPTVEITEKDKRITILFYSNTLHKLKEILTSKEIHILSGSISLLGEQQKVVVDGMGNLIESSDLGSLKLTDLDKKQ